MDPEQRRLVVIDGSKALRAATNAVFGQQHSVQRCRARKLRNMLNHFRRIRNRR
jgi:transposase-like protein